MLFHHNPQPFACDTIFLKYKRDPLLSNVYMARDTPLSQLNTVLPFLSLEYKSTISSQEKAQYLPWPVCHSSNFVLHINKR